MHKRMWNTILFHNYTDFQLDDSDIGVLEQQRRLLLENLSVVKGSDTNKVDPVLCFLSMNREPKIGSCLED